MQRYVLCFSLILVPAWGPAQTLRTESQLQKLIQEVRAEVNPGEAMDFVLRVYATDRWFTFPKFQETAEYLQGAMNFDFVGYFKFLARHGYVEISTARE